MDWLEGKLWRLRESALALLALGYILGFILSWGCLSASYDRYCVANYAPKDIWECESPSYALGPILGSVIWPIYWPMHLSYLAFK